MCFEVFLTYIDHFISQDCATCNMILPLIKNGMIHLIPISLKWFDISFHPLLRRSVYTCSSELLREKWNSINASGSTEDQKVAGASPMEEVKMVVVVVWLSWQFLWESLIYAVYLQMCKGLLWVYSPAAFTEQDVTSVLNVKHSSVIQDKWYSFS